MWKVQCSDCTKTLFEGSAEGADNYVETNDLIAEITGDPKDFTVYVQCTNCEKLNT